jgi:geranylgeranyl diphosphate synthase type 3
MVEQDSGSSSRQPTLPHSPDPALLEPFRYINSVPGKDVRGMMVDCFQLWLNVSSPDVLDSIKV